MPAPIVPPLPPPTSPYLQALERASKRGSSNGGSGISNKNGHGRALYYSNATAGGVAAEDDGDTCWVCGNATPASQAYCSDTCRDADVGTSEHNHLLASGGATATTEDGNVMYLYGDQPSPLLSPTMIAIQDKVPALVHSKRSSSSKQNKAAFNYNGGTGVASGSAIQNHNHDLASKNVTTTTTMNKKNNNQGIAATNSNNYNNSILSLSMSAARETRIDNTTANATATAGTAGTTSQPTRRRSSPRIVRDSSSQQGHEQGPGQATRHHSTKKGCVIDNNTSSSSPPSSSATSSPTKTADDDDDDGAAAGHVLHHSHHLLDENIENLLLPPPVESFAKKSPGFDYAYPYGTGQAIRAKSPPKSPTASRHTHNNNNNASASTHLSPTSTAARTTTGGGGNTNIASSGMMKKSSSQQSNRLVSASTKIVRSPALGATRHPQQQAHQQQYNRTMGVVVDGHASGSGSGTEKNGHADTTTTNSASSVTNTPPVHPSAGGAEVFHFRRKHLALDQTRHSSGSSNSGGSGASSNLNLKEREKEGQNHVHNHTQDPVNSARRRPSTANASLPAGAAPSSSTSISNSNAAGNSNHLQSHPAAQQQPTPRRYSSYGALGSTYTPGSALSPPLKPVSTHSTVSAQSSPAMRAAAAASSSTYSTRPSTANSGGAAGGSSSRNSHSNQDSPSLAATTLSNLLSKTTSRSEAAASDDHIPYPKRTHHNNASKSEILLRPSISNGQLGSFHHHTQTDPSSSSSSSTIAGPQPSNSDPKAKSNWLQRNKITKSIFAFNNRLTASSNIATTTSTIGSTIAAHSTCDRPNCPVNHSIPCLPPHQAAAHRINGGFSPLTRRASEPHSPYASPAIQYASVDPFDESFADMNSSRGSGYTARRRPSLSSTMTAPPAALSPTSAGVKVQDISGFAGFLSALHAQRKSATGASLDSSASVTDVTGTSEASTTARLSADLRSNAESSESGYDAQDEEQQQHQHQDRRGRSGRRSQLISTTTTTRATSENEVTGTTRKSVPIETVAKPAILNEKLANVVKASNDRSESPSSIDSVEKGGNGKPTRFLFSRGNAFKNSLNVSHGDTEEEDEVAANRTRAQAEAAGPALTSTELNPKSRSRETSFDPYTGTQRPMHNHSTSLGEGSQYIVAMQEKPTKDQLQVHTQKLQANGVNGDSALSDGPSSEEERSTSPTRRARSQAADGDMAEEQTNLRGRPTARRRSSGAGGSRLAVVSPFTALERAQTTPLNQALEGVDDGGGRGRSKQRGSAALHRSVSPARSNSRARGRTSPRLKGRQ